jgi:hypothetical protein
MTEKKAELPASPIGASSRVSNQSIPWTSTLNDLFSGGASVWFKIGGAAVATPLIAFFSALRAERSEDMHHPRDPWLMATIFICLTVAGAVLGAALSLKDIVQARMTAGRPVAFPLKLFFGFGIWSLLLVWCPLSLGIVTAATVITIGW